ncbi:hypothetical protein CP533_4725 [Ophiocordyceps camponoti-saundersi (nom. inval.)]|nr:hypothetical protein CP533_4725 [Ophiocordyceps camponoti-saundersi (nom. inval.)]
MAPSYEISSLPNGSLPEAYNPIVICGMALRLPGGLSTPSQLWDFILAKRDARSKVPPESYHSKFPRPGTIRPEFGYFFDDSVDLGALDTSFFSFTKGELGYVDPQQRLLLEVVRDCFESAGEVDYRGKNIGCFVGSFGDDWIENLTHDPQMYGKYGLMTGGDYALPNRLSFEYDLRGPSMSIRTACSSSLVALHQACHAIQRGECSSAVVAGCNLLMAPTIFIVMTVKGVISADASCKSFDAEANGYGRAEAVNAVYIKPLRDALRDGNPIRAIIRGTAVNSDGKTSGFSAPSAVAHEDLIRRAYSAAGIDNFSETAYVECHGTGTAVGDPVEAAGIGNVFGGDRGVYIGSVKPNVGHSEGASGLTSLIKAVLALEHQVIPPNIKFNTPNPKIPFEAKNLKVPTEPIPWPADRCLRASVNSFGMGGTNAHIVLESAVNLASTTTASLSKSSPTDQFPHLLVFSANTTASLERNLQELQEYLQHHPDALADLAYTLGARREHLAFRAASVVDSEQSEITAGPSVKIPSLPPELVMVFTGQGAQWPRMGDELYKSNAIFKRSILRMDGTLQTLPEPPAWSIPDEMMKGKGQSNLDRASYSQPICTAIQIALVDVLRELGIAPYAVIGHSSGELAAAYAAGRLTSKEALISAYYRGIVSEQVTRPGAMAAIGMSNKDVMSFLVPGVVIACENSPSSVTISGDLDQLDKAIEAIRSAQPEASIHRLKIGAAYHSQHMKDVGEEYCSLVDCFLNHDSSSNKLQHPAHFFSTVTGERLGDDDIIDSRYLQANLESPVLFQTALESLVNYSSDKQRLLFLEVGPHSALSGPIRQTLDQTYRSGHQYITCLTRFKRCSESFLSALGQLYCHGIRLDFDALHADRKARVLTDLPTYCWDHSFSTLYEPRHNKEWRSPRYPRHELAGVRVNDSTENEPCWRNVLHLEHVPWLRDHKIRGAVVFPAAAYLAMVGAALGQLNSGVNGYHVRNLVLKTAMVLSDLQSTEILLSLRRVHGSDWYDFGISSHNGVTWIEHCYGQARSSQLEAIVDQNGEVEKLPRLIQGRSWYQTLKGGGLEFGPAFQRVDDLSSSATEQVACARVLSTADEAEYYPVHPTTIDGFFQTTLAARFQGLDWEAERIPVPTSIGEIEVYDCSTDLGVRSWVTASNGDTIFTDGKAFGLDGSVAVRFKQAILRPVAASQSIKPRLETQSAARLYWSPDLHFLRLSDHVSSSLGWKEDMKLLDRLTWACVDQALASLDEHGVMSSSIPHMQRFQTWLRRQPVSGCGSSQEVETLSAQLSATPAAAPAKAMTKVLENIVPLCKGEVEPLEVLMTDGVLHELYDYLNQSDCLALLKALGHAQPKQRVLEIGAGTGGTTAQVIQHLMCSTYTFTDISAAFFPAAKKRFKKHESLVYKTLDITKDPCSQGFEPESFDLIIAANVLHATPSLHETLVNVRKLLHPQGRLLLQELCPVTKFANFIVGILPGWWAGEADGRPEEPYVSASRWEEELKQAGFNGLDDVAYDATPPYHANAYMLATPCVLPLSESSQTVHKSASLLCDAASEDVAASFQKVLSARGYHVRIQDLESPLPAGQHALVLVDTRSPFFHDLDASKFSAFQSFVNQLQLSHSGALWVTRSSQIDCHDPRFSSTLGVIRTLRSELGLEIATCEINDVSDENVERVVDVFDKFHCRLDGESAQLELEYAIEDDTVYTGRILPFFMNEELESLGGLDLESDDTVLQLDVGTRGLLESLVWKATAKRQLLGHDEVEIEVDTAGDLLVALRTRDGMMGRLGFDAAGIVRRVGLNVSHLSPGDRVFTLSPGCLSTSVVTSASRCVRIPDSLPLEDAVTMPLVFSTAIYSLIDVAQLDKSQSILIHSACGGTGIAAIQLSKMIGATIYVTVGCEEKAEHLVKTYGLKRDHIFNSRDASFLTGTMTLTRGRGVDLVLNSLCGDLLDASCQCVAEGGRIIDLARADTAENGQLPLHLFKPNTSYSVVDMMDLVRVKPREGTRLLQSIVELYRQGHILPITPAQTFSAPDIKDCFKCMQSGQRIGKFRVSLKAQPRLLQPAFDPKTMTFSENASYLLVGGLGGLGAGLARWMAQHNAKHLIFLSRSAGDDADSYGKLCHELRNQGCSMTAVRGSVCNPSDVERAIKSATAPLKGIVNMSLVLRDNSILKMSLEEWKAATEPKVRGTWNLHQASLDQDLDFFLLFSSMCGIFGMPGQANYASSNSFVDAFALYRHRCGLPASVLDLGAVEGIGYVAKNPQVLESSKLIGDVRMTQKELFDALTVAICNGLPSRDRTSRGYVNPAQILTSFRSMDQTADLWDGKSHVFDNRFATYRRHTTDAPLANGTASKTNELAQFVTSAATKYDTLSQPQAGDFVASQIARAIFDLLMKPVEDESEIDLSRSLSDIGLDSLGAVELRSWWKVTFGLEISVLEIMSFASCGALGQHALRGLVQRFWPEKIEGERETGRG